MMKKVVLRSSIESRSFLTRFIPLDNERRIPVAQLSSRNHHGPAAGCPAADNKRPISPETNSSYQFAGLDLVHITPDPTFPRLDGADQWMLCLVEMPGGVLVLGRVAAAHMPARETQTQMHPRIASLDTFLTHMFIRFPYLDLIKMRTFLRHRFLLHL